jgi:tetratricopeptide (TPR) repeat protein
LDWGGTAYALANIGATYNLNHKGKNALKPLNEALEITRSSGDQELEATIVNNIGFSYALIDDPRRSLDSFERALLLYRELKDPASQAMVLNNMEELRALGTRRYSAKIGVVRTLSSNSILEPQVGSMGHDRVPPLPHLPQAVPDLRSNPNRRIDK